MSLPEPERLSEEALREYVQNVLSGRVFCSGHLRPGEDPSMVWYPILFGALGPAKIDLPEPPETIPEDWTVEQFEEYPAKHAAIKAKLEAEALKCWEHFAKHIGGFWEFNSKALPRSINGLPCFMSVKVMHIEDWRRANVAIMREQERLANLDV